MCALKKKDLIKRYMVMTLSCLPGTSQLPILQVGRMEHLHLESTTDKTLSTSPLLSSSVQIVKEKMDTITIALACRHGMEHLASFKHCPSHHIYHLLGL